MEQDKGKYGISKAFDEAVTEFTKTHEEIQAIYKRYEEIKKRTDHHV